VAVTVSVIVLHRKGNQKGTQQYMYYWEQ
jgi:hypothetical protein